VNLAETHARLSVERIGKQVFIQLLQLSGFVIIPDHLPPVPALDVAERGLERIISRDPVGFRPELVVDPSILLD
jgi:hypothetical protein